MTITILATALCWFSTLSIEAIPRDPIRLVKRKTSLGQARRSGIVYPRIEGLTIHFRAMEQNPAR